MKRYFILFCLFLTFFSTNESLFAKIIGYGYVNSNISKKKLKVRKKPSTKSKTKFKLSLNDQVVITSSSGKWFKIKHTSGKGWVKKKYIDEVSSFGIPSDSIKNPKKVVPKQNKSAAKSKVKKVTDDLN